MRKIALTLVATSMLLTSCETKTQSGAAIGAGTGALAGGLLGGWQGAAIGTAVGAVAGSALGYAFDQDDKNKINDGRVVNKIENDQPLSPSDVKVLHDSGIEKEKVRKHLNKFNRDDDLAWETFLKLYGK